MTATQRPSAASGGSADARHVDGSTFREVMGAVCTPVAVVTAMCGDRPHGTTVSAFSSLSLDPPMVVVSLDRDSELLRYVRRTHHTLALGLVVDAEHIKAQPLTYHLRAFGTHTALGDVSGS